MRAIALIRNAPRRRKPGALFTLPAGLIPLGLAGAALSLLPVLAGLPQPAVSPFSVRGVIAGSWYVASLWLW